MSPATDSNVPVTFGQAFAPGALLPTDGLSGTLSNGTTVPVQVETKATHPDGSVRHAILSAVVPSMSAGQSLTLNLVKAASATATGSAPTPAALLNAGFTASASINLGGVQYSASADAALKSGAYTTWLSGPLASEWIVNVPLTTSSGTAHPHLMARFAIRSYAGLNRARVDVTIENNWAYEPNPSNLTYDVQLLVGGTAAYTKTGMTHYHHARWRKELWWGAAPQTHLVHNTAYLKASRAIPNYDPSVVVSGTAISDIKTSWTGAKTEPMGPGLAAPYMPDTGGRPDIGLQPAWTVMYLLSGSKDVKDAAFGTATLAGSWPIHYRDRNTDRPLSILNYPYASLLANAGDMINPATGKSEAFPACTNCATAITPDAAHQPDFSYVPYLLTGDYYHLEELQFWAMYDVFQYTPAYRNFSAGLVKSDQVRGQAWAMRMLAEAAYITPDKDALKSQFTTFLSNNLDWFNASYVGSAASTPNALGVLTNGYALAYNNATGVAPWQDDFFTSAIGRANELGFTKAQSLLAWKGKFPVARMLDAGFCWIYGANYSMNMRDSSASAFYTTMSQVYQSTIPSAQTSLACGGSDMAAALGLSVGEMLGYSSSNTGYPSNMQPALAYSVDGGTANAASAWQKFMQRSVKPDYQNGPQFAIVPR
ncbi:hypothetical protein G3574_08305 [Noviherbaspirillum sp. 17J57-3]|uniref:PcRGLX/YetA-like N-terminal RIFT barrel domain-containing protein n=1 Tax=Noviherbaspirillum galbum TaxID=2709383 RepID=A0A6B3SJW5_9BURK|nr:hypothetical protein [Noviherbaspirillum galbum]